MSKLYNLSKKITAHTMAKGLPATGFTLSGYVKATADKYEYVNIYIPADRVIKKEKLPPDGNGTPAGFAITITFTDVVVREKKKKGDEAAKLRQTYEEIPF